MVCCLTSYGAALYNMYKQKCEMQSTVHLGSRADQRPVERIEPCT